MQELFKQRSEASVETASSFKQPAKRMRESIRVMSAMKFELTRRDSRDMDRMRRLSKPDADPIRSSASLRIR